MDWGCEVEEQSDQESGSAVKMTAVHTSGITGGGLIRLITKSWKSDEGVGIWRPTACESCPFTRHIRGIQRVFTLDGYPKWRILVVYRYVQFYDRSSVRDL